MISLKYFLYGVSFNFFKNDGTDSILYKRSSDISSALYIFSFEQQGDYTKYIDFGDLSNGLVDVGFEPYNGATDINTFILHMHTVILLSTDANSDNYTNTILNNLDNNYLDNYNGDFDTWFDRYIKYEDINNKCKIL